MSFSLPFSPFLPEALQERGRVLIADLGLQGAARRLGVPSTILAQGCCGAQLRHSSLIVLMGALLAASEQDEARA